MRNRFLRSAALLVALLLVLVALSGCFPEDGARESTEAWNPGTDPVTPEETTGGGTTDADTGTDDPNGEDPEPQDFIVSRPELTLISDPDAEAEYEALLLEFSACLKAGTEEDDAMLERYRALEDFLYGLRLSSNLAYVESCLYKTDAARAETLLALETFYNSAIREFLTLHTEIADSKYRNVIFEGWGDEEVSDVLDSAETYDEECEALQNELSLLRSEWRSLSDAEFETRSEEIYRRVTAVGTELAERLGYEGFLEYTYDALCDREYTPTEAQKLTEYAGDTLIPLLEAAIDRISSASLSDRDVNELRTVLYGSVFTSDRVRELIDGYYAALGGEIYEAYLAFWEEGYYYVGFDSALSETRAFSLYFDVVDAPAIYFGPGYQSAFTFVHEFGHYYSYLKNGNEGDLSYDLAEAQSQGDEWLFLAYLVSEVYRGTTVAEYLEAHRVANDLLALTVSLAVNEFERLVSLDGGKAAIDGDLDLLYRDAVNAVWSYDALAEILGYAPEAYWRRVVVEQSGYYVSYAISMIPAIELYTLAVEDLSVAGEIYESLLVSGGFLDALAGARLGSPFDADVYEKIARLFAE